MAWAIDAEQYMELLKEQYLHNKFMNHGEAAKAWQGAMQLFYDMPTLTPPNEWVSVKDRLPETAGEYLVVYHPCHRDNVSAEICVGIDSFRGKTAWAKKKYQRVTHWMPLPEPPKENQQHE